MAARPKYRRILLKLSGEAFGAGQGTGLKINAVRDIAAQIAQLSKEGVQVAVVVGGGNIVRGKDFVGSGIPPASADMMGMLATVVNGIALQETLIALGAHARLQTAIPMPSVAEPFIRQRCIRHLEKGRVVVLAAGTGSPHFTTDTAAALRAREISADVLVKATNVDGVYSDDPRKNRRAKRYQHLSYDAVIKRKLGVMDATAVTLCREGRIPIIVLDMGVAGNIRRAVFGERVGTRIEGK